MKGVMIPSVSAGSSQRETSVMWTPHVMVPSGAAVAETASPETNVAARSPRTRRVNRLMESSMGARTVIEVAPTRGTCCAGRYHTPGGHAMDLGLEGKRAIVTGGSLGIGKAIARELAREGADVVIVARTKDTLEAAARELAAMVAQAAAQLGGLHILVNSGSAPGGSATATGPIETIVDEDLLQDFNVKYVGALRCARAAIPYLKEQGWGRIINISGTNARNAGNLSGGARNTSLVHLSKTLAVQLGRFGITVNCVHPGITRTERTPRLLAARARELGVD